MTISAGEADQALGSTGLGDRLRFAATRVATAREELSLAVAARDELIVEAHDSQGMTVLELARVLGISRATVTGILGRN